jgi:urease beta subunit
MRPGEIMLGDGPIQLNPGRPTVELTVTNTSDHTIWIGSHYPFFEVNKRLAFDRAKAWGMRLDIPAGDCVGWQPGETKTVQLVPFAGRRVVRGFNGLTDGLTTPERRPGGLRRARDAGYANAPSSE